MLNTEPVRSCSRVHCVHTPIDRHLVNRRPSEHRGRAAQRAVRRARHRAARREAQRTAGTSGPQSPAEVLEKALAVESDKSTTDTDEGMEKPQEQLLILLDWDDTVLPTTYIAQQQLSLECPVPDDVKQVLDAYALVARDTLQCLKSHGTVIIVTNAETGWVELTCAKFLPALQGLVEGLERVSARSSFEHLGFVTPAEWKTEAFHELVSAHQQRFPDAVDVLSVGDAGHEREAVYRVAQRLDIAAKSIKLVEQPDLAYLQREHELLQERLGDLLAHDGPLDVRVDAEGQ